MTKNTNDVNVYFLENNTSKLAKQGKGGQFYNAYRNSGEVLNIEDFIGVNNDLFEIEKAAFDVDPTFKKIGGIILARNEKISSLSIFETVGNKLRLQSIEASRIKVIEIEKIILEKRLKALLEEAESVKYGLAELEIEKRQLVKK